MQTEPSACVDAATAEIAAPMRLLCAIGGMYAGGSERQLLQLLESLDRARYQPELYLIASGGELFERIPSDVPVHVFEERCPAPRAWLPGGAFRARVRDLAGVLETRNIELIYDRTYHMSLITAAAARLRPTPRISTIVSDPRSDFETNRERFRWIKRRLLRRAYAEADVAACVSEGVREAAADYHRLPVERFDVFHNLYDVEDLRAKASEPPAEPFARKAGRRRIVAAGRLHPAKAYDVLVEAFAELSRNVSFSDVELVIVGQGPLETELRQQVAGLHLGEKIVFTGFQPNPLPLVASADLFCLSSRYEGLPNALIEALLLGVPVVSTDCPHGPREILEGGRWGALVPSEDAGALAGALAGAFEHLEPFRQRALAARESAARRFSLTAGLARFDELAALARGRFAERGK